MDIKLIAAVGKNGELGLNGGLPWGNLFPEDRKQFRDMTAGGVIIVGARTWPSVRHLDGTHDRALLCDNTGVTPLEFLKLYRIELDQTVWIAGGAKTYLRWLPLVGEKHITVLDWTGPADTWMPAKVWTPNAVEHAQ